MICANRGDIVIRFVNASKTYDNGVKALSNINVKVDKGEFVFIVGPSGAGKSTLIKLLLKEEDLTSGSVFLNEMDITKVKSRRIPYIRRIIGVVFRISEFFPIKLCMKI